MIDGGVVDSIDPNRFHPCTFVSEPAFSANVTDDAALVDHDCASDVIGMFTHPAAQELFAPFATVTDPYFVPSAGWFVHRVDVDTLPELHTSTADAVHEYDHVSYRFSVADRTFTPLNAVFENVRKDLALFFPSYVPTFSSRSLERSDEIFVCTNASKVGRAVPFAYTGSTVTGKTRASSSSQSRSTPSRSVTAVPDCSTIARLTPARWRCSREASSTLASHASGASNVETTSSSPSTNSIRSPAISRAVSPSETRSGTSHDTTPDSSAGAGSAPPPSLSPGSPPPSLAAVAPPTYSSSASRSEITNDCSNPSRVACTTRSIPGHAPAYVAADPSSTGAGSESSHATATDASSPAPTSATGAGSPLEPATSPESTTPSGTAAGAIEPSFCSTRVVSYSCHAPSPSWNRTGAAYCVVVTVPSGFTHVVDESVRSAVTSTRSPVARACTTADGKSTDSADTGADTSGEGSTGGSSPHA